MFEIINKIAKEGEQSLTNEELLKGIAFYEKLHYDLLILGDVFLLASNECKRRAYRLSDVSMDRGIVDLPF